MKKILLATILIFPFPIGSNAEDQENKNSEFLDFWTNFKIAMEKNDKEQVASMTKFPFSYQAYGNKSLSRSGFIKKYDEIFNRTTKLCFFGKKTVPIENDHSRHGYLIFCNSSIYSFEKFEGKYKLFEKYPDD